ncbi:6-phosphogluconolactonase [Cellulomonas sp. APG4]|uniref:6-phosphogluconolactonase n=1 Tax=Cellulomonas sp. APG4 TaxID=1538656 RepID=UPI00137A607A|nr:6-phosphogluconolactonase [Cellulomonas sp. APG4]NCT89772.1 6-phosphogluconolactonase [Cellulomonas sp. APG4]
MTSTQVCPDADRLARLIGAAIVTELTAPRRSSPFHLVLTGGTIGIRGLAEVRGAARFPQIDWSTVHLWWGDERFLPAGHPDRNETQARAALIDHLDIPAENVHPVPAADAPGVTSPEDAARLYADELVRVVGPAGDAPSDDAGPVPPELDLVLLGMGPDGHVASLFPGHPGLDVVDRLVVGVHGSPKPPPERVSLTFPALNGAQTVLLLVSGAEKAPAVGRALRGDDLHTTPAAGVAGRSTTRWLLDMEAASFDLTPEEQASSPEVTYER